MFLKKLILALCLSIGLTPLLSYAGEKPTAADPTPVLPSNKVPGLELPANLTVNHDEGFVKVEAAAAGTVKWLILCEHRVKFVSVNDKTIVISIPPVKTNIDVFAVTTVDSKVSNFARTRITVNGPATTEVTPPVDPPPANTANHLAIFVIDNDTVTTEQAKILNSKEMQKAIADQGVILKIIDKKSPIIRDRKLESFVKNAGGPPVLIVMDGTGLVKYAKKMPDSEKAILDTIKEHVGK